MEKMDLKQQIADATKQHEAALAASIAKLERESLLRALCPDRVEPKSLSRADYCEVDVLHYDVTTAEDAAHVLDAWGDKYGTFLPVGQYRAGSTVITAYPWEKYAEISPERISDDGVIASNHAGRGFNSLSLEFYPNVPRYRIKVVMSEAFRANFIGLHGHVSANYNSHGDPIYNSIHKVPPAAVKEATFWLQYSGGSDDAANFVCVFTRDKLRSVLQPGDM